RFELAGSYVYLLVNLFGEQLGGMWSETNNIGWWADKEVSFCVPVKWFHDDELVGLAVVSPFVFASSGRAAITDREVNGRPTVRASIESPPDRWLSESGPVAERKLLRVGTEVFPAMHLGQEAKQRTLIEIDGLDCLPANDDVGWRLMAERWGATLGRDLKRKSHIKREQADEIRDAKALARRILAQEGPINWITLKQYRDAAEVDKACYQAMVHTTRSIKAVYDLREIEERIHVRLHKYPGQPIAETLGLEMKHIDSRAGAVAQTLQPMHPFWMRASVEEALGSVLCWRDQDGEWTSMPPWSTDTGTDGSSGRDGPGLKGGGYTSVGTELGDSQPDSQPDSQRLREDTEQWLHHALTQELSVILELVSKLPQKERKLLDQPLTASIGRSFESLLASAPPSTIADSMSNEELLALVDACHRLLGDRLKSAADGCSRLSRSQARESLTRLDELQVVIETVLSEQWENRDNPRLDRKTGSVKP
ncbi:MAG: hypothetical protein WBG92_24755, partial [Thiohalocapsa sp.]